MVAILMYHRVCSRVERARLRSPFVVDEHVFDAQLAHLRRNGYRAVDVDALVSGRADGKAVLITFDDGYLDNLTVAAPLLEKHGMRATIFVVADWARRANWWDRAGATSSAPLLSPTQIREMARCGFTFGSHGLSHSRLCELDDDAAARELRDSKRALEDVLSAPVVSLAYPYGNVDGRAKSLVQRSGYRAAFAVNSGPARALDDVYEIRRVLVANRAHRGYLFAKLSGVERALRASLARLRGGRRGQGAQRWTT